MNQLFNLQQALGGYAMAWLSVAYMIILFVACLYKPERVCSSTLFRWACTLFVLSLVLPVLLQSVLTVMAPGMGQGVAGGFINAEPMYAVVSAIGPVFLSVSMFFAFAALAPKPQAPQRARDATPAKHPLD